MTRLLALAAWAALATSTSASASASPQSPRSPKSPCGTCPPDRDTAALGTRLSPSAKVYFPCSDGFEAAKLRWSVQDAPGVSIVVVPGVETDVDETVKFANAHGFPFLAVTSSHGNIITQGRMKHGIEIRMHQLDGVEILGKGDEARIGGGALSGSVSQTLWKSNKQAVTAASECIGIVGPGLGGGHGFLQGRHGLIADQFTSMNVVLADGSRRTISKSQTPDLWWGMLGAGHNFAIVTSFTMKIYDVKYPDWASEGYIFTGDKIEAIHELLDEHVLNGGNPPVDVSTFSVITSVPTIDPVNPVIIQYIGQEGTKAVSPKYTDLFRKIGPVSVDTKSGVYIELPVWIDDTVDSPGCQKTGAAHIRFPIELRSYNITGIRRAYDAFAAGIRETPALNASAIFVEGYSLQGVRAVRNEDTAYPFRDDNIIVAPSIEYKPAGAALEKKAIELGESVRRILYESSGRRELHTYVNYAYGTETTENTYGYEGWRQTKLKALKKKYDPKGRFSFYAPIA